MRSGARRDKGVRVGKAIGWYNALTPAEFIQNAAEADQPKIRRVVAGISSMAARSGLHQKLQAFRLSG
jgi:hypothetical protein